MFHNITKIINSTTAQDDAPQKKKKRSTFTFRNPNWRPPFPSQGTIDQVPRQHLADGDWRRWFSLWNLLTFRFPLLLVLVDFPQASHKKTKTFMIFTNQSLNPWLSLASTIGYPEMMIWWRFPSCDLILFGGHAAKLEIKKTEAGSGGGRISDSWARKTWKGKMRGSKISEGFYWTYPSWLVLWVIPNSWDLIRWRHSVPVHETKNKNPSGRVIRHGTSRCFFVSFMGLFVSTLPPIRAHQSHQGWVQSTRSAILPDRNMKLSKTECDHLISSDEIHLISKLKNKPWWWKSSCLDSIFFVHWFPCDSLFISDSMAFLFKDSSLPRASTYPSNCCYGSIIFVSSKNVPFQFEQEKIPVSESPFGGFTS